jgi:hypothetical protein
VREREREKANERDGTKESGATKHDKMRWMREREKAQRKSTKCANDMMIGRG